MFKQFGFAIDKIFDRVHIANNPSEKTVDDYVQFETVPETIGTEFLPDLLKAIKEHELVTFDYTSFASEKTKNREVLPLLLKEYRNRWYLISFNIEKERIITFGLDRMKNLILTENYHLQKIDFDPDLYFKHSIGITSYDTAPEIIEFKIDKLGSKYILSQPLHSSQTLVKEGKNRNTFRIEVLISEELKRLIMSYGSQIEVLKPVSFRNQLINEAISLHERYS